MKGTLFTHLQVKMPLKFLCQHNAQQGRGSFPCMCSKQLKGDGSFQKGSKEARIYCKQIAQNYSNVLQINNYVILKHTAFPAYYYCTFN